MSLSFVMLTALAVSAQSPSLYVPDVGVSESYLISLGTGVDRYLLKRLESPGERKYYNGIIARLETGRERNREVSDAAIRFIKRQVNRRHDVTETAQAIFYAFRVVALRGEQGDFDFLANWVRDDAQAKRVRCFTTGQSSERMADSFRIAAIQALGQADFKGTEPLLEELLKRPPNSLTGGTDSKSTIQEAVDNFRREHVRTELRHD